MGIDASVAVVNVRNPIILINPEKHPHTKVYEGTQFIYWVMSQEGKDAINSYRMNNLQLFKAAP